MLVIQTNSRHPVSHVAFTPDGGAFALVQPHSGVTLCDRVSGQVKVAMPVPRMGELTAIAFCNGGTKLAVGSRKGLHLFDTATGKLLAGRTGGMFASRALVPQGDDLLALTWSVPRDIRLPRAAGEPLVSSSRRMTTRATLLTLSPCGRWVVGAYARSGLSLSDTHTRRVVATIDYLERPPHPRQFAVTFAANSSRFAVGDGYDIRVYDTPDQDSGDEDQESEFAERAESDVPVAPKPKVVLRAVFRLAPPDDYQPVLPRLHFADESEVPNPRWFPPVALTPDGRGLLVRRPRNRVQLWDVASGRHAGEWSWRQEVTCLAVAPDGLTAVAGCRFGRAVAWDLEPG
jgi:WD40 repeat protein